MLEKQCRNCRKSKEITQFSKKDTCKDGHSTICKTCDCERSRAYAQQHKESVKEYKKSHYMKNQEVNIEYSRKHYLENKQSISDAMKKYYLKNKEVIRELRKEHYLANKELIRTRRKRYRLQNKEKVQSLNSKRRAKKSGAEGNHTAEEIQYLKEIQNYQCLMCRRTEPEIKLTFDHIVPLSKGGGDGIGNGQMLCQSCNSSKNAKFIDFRGVKPSKSALNSRQS